MVEITNDIIIHRENTGDMVVVNIGSATQNMDRFRINLKENKVEPRIIVLTETWIKEHNRELFEIPNYKSYHKINNQNRAGGVSIYIKDNINSIISEQNQIETLTFNSLSVKYIINGIASIIIGI
jgi:exonuclease III